MAELISWSDQYSVKNSLMDSQHKKLVALINELHSAMKEARGKDVLEKTLDDLVKYTQFHFDSEEALMLKANYAEFKLHQQVHKKLTIQVLDLQKKFKGGKSLLSMEVLNFLKNWLVEHIQGTDKKYSNVI